VVLLAYRPQRRDAWKEVHMRAPRSVQEGARIALLLAAGVSIGALAACSEAAGSGDTALVIQVADDSVTVENQTGQSLNKVEVSIIPKGIPRPYVAIVGHLSSGEKRTFMLSTFRMDGTPFRRGVANGRVVRMSGTDVSGKSYQREVPFE
jgi:hypothetical protein